MKIRYKLLIQSYNLKGKIAFVFNSLQSILSDFLFGISYFFIFDFLVKKQEYWIYGLSLTIFLFIYFIFFIPLWGYLMEKCEQIYLIKLEQFVFEKKLNSRYNKNEHSSKFISLLQHDVYHSSKVAGWNLVVFFQALISGVVSSVIIGAVSLKILFFLYGMALIAIIFDSVCSKYIKKITEINRIHLETKTKNIIDFVNNILVIKIYNQEKKAKKNLDNIVNKMIKNNKKLNIVENFTNLINNMIFHIGFKSVVFIFGLKLVSENEITFGKLLLVYSMINGIIFVAEYMGGYIKTLKKIGVSSKKVDEFIEKNKNSTYKKKSVVFENVKKIELKNVSFGYNENKIFDNLNLIFNFPNDYIILGNNASGKSTLIKIILGLKKLDLGKIVINDIVLNNKNENILPFGFVPQQAFVYSGTVLENLVMGNKKISEKEIKKAIKTSEIQNWVDSLEAGLLTNINEKGKNISKGEKMRLCIARELLKKSEILFLDEPDANIDLDTIEKIIKNIKKNYPLLNLIIITHLSKREMYCNFKTLNIEKYNQTRVCLKTLLKNTLNFVEIKEKMEVFLCQEDTNYQMNSGNK